MTQHKTAHIAPFGLRMQPELRTQIENAAKDSGRSMNAEICARLENSFTIDDNGGLDSSKFVRLAFISGHEVPEPYKQAYKAVFGIDYADSGELSSDYLIGRLKNTGLLDFDLSGIPEAAIPYFEEARKKYLDSIDQG